MRLFAPHITDSYKLGHGDQYAKGTTLVVSNFTPRNFSYARGVNGKPPEKMVFFGLQYAIEEYLHNQWGEFFGSTKSWAVAKYARRINSFLGEGKGDGAISRMEALHDLGYLPIKIKALPEGSHVPAGVPVFTVENTHPDFHWLINPRWLTNYIETVLSATVWPMCNAASLSEQYYLLSKKYGKLTGASEEFWLPFANHNFSMRGMRGIEDATMSGAAHLLFSKGTDTLSSIDFLEEYYGADARNEFIATSVNASEHATVTQLIATLGSEEKAFKYLINEVYPTGIFSYVSDSNDYWYVIEHLSFMCKADILARQPDKNGVPACVTFRPDSSLKTPYEVILGDPEAEEGSAERLGTLEVLWKNFGGTYVKGADGKDYRLLDSHVRVIYGESINLEMAEKIYKGMADDGWCVGNVFFGIGSWSFLEDSSRDSYGLAMKATYSEVSGKSVELYKNPKTSSFKKSAKGLIRVERENGTYVAYDQQTPEQFEQGELKTVFEDGFIIPVLWNEVEQRAKRES